MIGDGVNPEVATAKRVKFPDTRSSKDTGSALTAPSTVVFCEISQ